MTAGACNSVPVATATLDLPLQRREAYCELAAELAWETNDLVVIVGETPPDKDHARVLLCSYGCCSDRPRVIVVVPDVEVVSRWGSVPKGCTMTIARGPRTAYVFRGTQ